MSKKNFNYILNRIKNSNEPYATVFDLDSTLFCMTERTRAIIKHCIQSTHFKTSFPNEFKKLNPLSINKTDWGVADILSNHGISKKNPVVAEIRKCWEDLFFDSRFLQYDQPYAGSSEYLNALSENGAEIFYLTARHKNSMLDGTLESLKKWNFPIVSKSRVILKPKSSQEDAEYKLEELKKISSKYKNILFCDNEPVVLNTINQFLPDVEIFWINSTHSRKQNPPEGIKVLSMDYNWTK